MSSDVLMQEASVQEFHLAASLEGHKQDVRSVCGFVSPITNEVIVATASRDKTVKLWRPFAKGEETLFKTLSGHEHFVASVAVIPPTNSFLPGMICIASGSNDKLIIVWDIETGKPALSLIGHTDTVCCLYPTIDGNLVSASWDKTLRIWSGSNSIAELKGHTLAVWAVLSLDNGDIVSGAADKTIKIWRNKTCLLTLSKHTDVVRSLTILPNIGFASCANDGVIFTWTSSGECLQELNGHSSFIYSISTLRSMSGNNNNSNSNSSSSSSSSSSGALEIISASEDRTVRVWKGTSTEQSIMHPGSVWDVSALPNGDFVSACSDGVARVWSRDSSRKASEAVIELFQHSLSSQAVPSGTVGDIQTDKLPGIEALKNPGTKDQQNKIIKNGNVVELYQWSASANQWNKVGEVVDARGQSKQILNGKEYDYVFDVDIGDGMMRKLGYNNGENPYLVAQQFLWDNELNQEWLDQVAQFIVQNTKPITIGVGEDPTINSSTASTYKDPYTGGGRYVPGSETPVSSNLSSKPKSKHFPLTRPVVFDSGNYQGILNSVLQNNDQLKKENNPNAISGDEVTAVTNMMNTISEKTKYHVTSFSDLEYGVLISKLIKWPTNIRFPALDILRLVALHPDGSRKLKKEKNLIEIIEEAAFKDTPFAPKLMGLRFFTNLFQWGNTFEYVLQGGRNKIMERISESIKSDNKNLRLATAYLLQNYANNLPTGSSKEDAEVQIITLLVEATKVKETEEDIIYRTLVSIGSLAHNDCSEMIKSFGLHNFVQECKKSNADAIKGVASDILLLLK